MSHICHVQPCLYFWLNFLFDVGLRKWLALNYSVLHLVRIYLSFPIAMTVLVLPKNQSDEGYLKIGYHNSSLESSFGQEFDDGWDFSQQWWLWIQSEEMFSWFLRRSATPSRSHGKDEPWRHKRNNRNSFQFIPIGSLTVMSHLYITHVTGHSKNLRSINWRRVLLKDRKLNSFSNVTSTFKSRSSRIDLSISGRGKDIKMKSEHQAWIPRLQRS